MDTAERAQSFPPLPLPVPGVYESYASWIAAGKPRYHPLSKQQVLEEKGGQQQQLSVSISPTVSEFQHQPPTPRSNIDTPAVLDMLLDPFSNNDIMELHARIQDLQAKLKQQRGSLFPSSPMKSSPLKTDIGHLGWAPQPFSSSSPIAMTPPTSKELASPMNHHATMLSFSPPRSKSCMKLYYSPSQQPLSSPLIPVSIIDRLNRDM